MHFLGSPKPVSGFMQWLGTVFQTLMLTVFLSFGTTLVIVLSSLLLYVHVTGERLQWSFEPEVGAIAILGYSLPFVFFTCLLTTLERDLSQAAFVPELQQWAKRLGVSLLLSTVSVGGVVALLKALAIAHPMADLLLIGIVFPALCLWLYCLSGGARP